MILVTIGPDIWAGASYPNVLATFQVGRSEMVHYLHTQLPPIFGEGRGEKREAVPMIFLYSYALWVVNVSEKVTMKIFLQIAA